MFVNKIPFVVNVSRGVNFTTVEFVSQKLKTVLANSICKTFHFYKNNGYIIKTFLVDRDFECVCDSFPCEKNLNTTVKNKHVPYIDHKNHVIKEHARELISNFPFKKIPR